MVASMVLAAAPALSLASVCDTWTNNAGGNWSVATNWSKKHPPEGMEEACITENGTYTVIYEQTGQLGEVRVGSTAGTQTLLVQGAGSELSLAEGMSVGAHGALQLSGAARLGAGGSFTNAGTVTVAEGEPSLEGNLTNTGTLTISANAEYQGGTLTNEGAIKVANGAALNARGSVLNEANGTITGEGSGAIVMSASLMGTPTFTEGSGVTRGTEPVILDSGTGLDYSGAGSSLVTIAGSVTLKGNPAKGQSLAMQGGAVLADEGGLTNGGTISVAGAATLELGGVFLNHATLFLGSAAHLQVDGSYTQGGKGTLQVAIASPSSYGVLSVSEAANLGGKLQLARVPPFVGELGQAFAVLGSSGRTGTFRKVKGNKITKKLIFSPSYTSGGVTLVVTTK